MPQDQLIPPDEPRKPEVHKPEQIWPPADSKKKPLESSESVWPPAELANPVYEDELPVNLEWSDEVGKIDEAIEEIRKINGHATKIDELEFEPELSAAAVAVQGEQPEEPARPRTDAPCQKAGTVQSTWRVRPQTENEIAHLWSNTFLSVDHPAPKLILVTSARRGDGATQIAFSLAVVGADSTDELRICLVDFNFRHPIIARTLRIRSARGLTDVLTGTAALDDAIHTIKFKSGRTLSVLPAGARAEHPLSLLKSRQVRVTLTQLKDRFDHVIIDAACAAKYPDAQILGSQVDGALLVVRAADTPRETVAEAKKRLDLSGARCLGLVMNQRSDPIPSVLYEMT